MAVAPQATPTVMNPHLKAQCGPYNRLELKCPMQVLARTGPQIMVQNLNAGLYIDFSHLGTSFRPTT